jgi:outer membrane protein assembly factor BamB
VASGLTTARVAGRVCTAAAIALLAVCFSPTGVHASIHSTDGSWTSFGHDDQLTNDVDDPALDSEAVPRLARVWSRRLDGAVVASPLAARTGPGGRLVVFVATEGGSVYALDGATGAVVWRQSFGTVETTGCGTYGFSSTGAVDAAGGVLYVAGADGEVHALDTATGDEAPGWPVRLVRRTGYTYIYGGLRLVGDSLYVPIASYCDELDPDGVPAEGRLVKVDVADRSISTFDPVPGFGNLGGVWGWGGASVDPDGSFLYTGIGNAQAWSDDCACFADDAGYGDSLVKLTPDLTVADWDRPEPVEGAADEDLGAAPLLFQPPGCPPLAAANDKDGMLYIWRRDDLAAGPLQALPLSDGVDAFVGEPSWSSSSGVLVDSGATFLYGGKRLGAGLLGLTLERGCTFKRTWSAVLGDGPEPPPLVVDDVVVASGGTTGNWEAFTLGTGRLLWRFDTHGTATWGPPIAVDGMVVAGDVDGVVRAFRPRPAGARRLRHD